MNNQALPFLDHLSEFRSCLIKAISGLFLAMLLCFFFADEMLFLLKRPMLEILPDNFSFVVLSPQEYFFTKLKASLFFGLILSSPWLFFQIWSFVAPGLYKKEKLMLFWFVIFASICFLSGILFAYFLVFPPTFNFFIDSLPQGVVGNYSIAMLYGFMISVLLAFGIVFQMPIAIFLLIFFELVEINSLIKYRKIVLVMSFVIGAVLTPPDPITQIMLAIPAYALFELGLLLGKVTLAKKHKS